MAQFTDTYASLSLNLYVLKIKLLSNMLQSTDDFFLAFCNMTFILQVSNNSKFVLLYINCQM